MKKILFLFIFLFPALSRAEDLSSPSSSFRGFSALPIVIENSLSTPAVGIQLSIPKGTHIYGPAAQTADQRTSFTVSTPTGGTLGFPIFPKPHLLPYGGEGYSGQQFFWMPITLPKNKGRQTVHFHFSYLACNHLCTPMTSTFSVTVPDIRNHVVPIDIYPPPDKPSTVNLTLPLALMAFAFLGGLLLNFMPCVFPILSLKAFSAFKKKEALLYASGVLTGFTGFAAAVLFLKSLGKEVGWGFQMQSPVFVFGLAVLFFLMGLVAAGLFPAPIFSYSQKTSRGASFLTGILAVFVASPCTAPFMGVAVGAALLHSSAPDLVLIFLTLGLGFSFPFLLLAFLPFTKKILPKPGRWMEHFKVLMAFFLFGSVLWLLIVLLELTSAFILLMCLSTLLFLALFGFCLKEKLFKTAVFFSLLFAGFIFVSIPSAHQIEWEPYTPERLEFAQSKNIPVLIKGTAAWCLTCAVNDRTLNSDKAMKLFRQKGVLIMTADFTKQDESVKAWLASFDRSGVPLYVFYGKHGPLVLPALLTYDSLEDMINDNVYF